MCEGPDESRSAAAEARDRVEHPLLDHGHPSDRTEDLLHGKGIVLHGGLAQREGRGSLADSAGQVRHDPHDPTSTGEDLLDERRSDAGGQRDDEAVPLDVCGDSLDERSHVLRFRREEEDVGFRREFADRFCVSDAVLRGDFFGTRRNRIAHEDPRGRHDAADEESAHEGLAHLPNACDSDCLLSVHRSTTAATVRLARMAGSPLIRNRTSRGYLNLGRGDSWT